MKRLIGAVLFVVMLSACAGRSGNPLPQVLATPTGGPTDLPPALETPTSILVGLSTPAVTASASTPAENAAAASLAANLGVPAGQIIIVSTDAVTWPDGCLGVQRIGVMCTQNQVPGFKIILEAKGTQYEFHTNEDGSAITPAGGIQASAPAEDQALKHLAQAKGIDPGLISVVSDADVEWPDSCLGVAEAGTACSQIVTPGHLIILEAGAVRYEYHTNRDGGEVQPATVFITWTRSGGFAGRCDEMTIYLSGEIHSSSCTQTKDSNLKIIMTPDDQTQLGAWLAKYDNVRIDLSDPKGAADGMTRLMTLNGDGNQQVAAADQQSLYDWGLSIYQRIQPGK